MACLPSRGSLALPAARWHCALATGTAHTVLRSARNRTPQAPGPESACVSGVGADVSEGADASEEDPEGNDAAEPPAEDEERGGVAGGRRRQVANGCLESILSGG